MNARATVGRLFKNWEREIARPILVTLLTAMLLFVCSLAFRPVRSFLFPIDSGYPLWCTAEAYAKTADPDLHVDVYVINRTDEAFTRDKLLERLDQRAGASPDITSQFVRGEGTIATALPDSEFNRDKGSLSVMHHDRTLTIGVDQIQPHAILKVTAVVTGLPERPGVEITRGMATAIPFDMSPYQLACYSR
ncbi:MAG TPA: hypothetical protein VN654_31195 [Vicinamibacterales bacterium]|nr:hypothetical protein [Vicinamibacterales bacterium]